MFSAQALLPTVNQEPWTLKMADDRRLKFSRARSHLIVMLTPGLAFQLGEHTGVSNLWW